MASPPFNSSFPPSLSPPYPSNSPLPQSKKRPSEMAGGAPVKRRKASLKSTSTTLSAHPLRQTSFPPEGQGIFGARSPSVDSMSVVSGAIPTEISKRKRGPGRKSKGKDDTVSLAGTAVSGPTGKGRRGQSREADGEEDDEVEDNMDVAVAANTVEEKQKENELRNLLIRNLDEQQMSRFEQWRQARLPDPVVRRLINQTLSQSVPQTVILAVRSVTKIYAGEIIERARKIQTQWLELSGEDQLTGLQSPPGSDDGESKPKEMRRGPLTPDHLREAFRRIRLERNGNVGLLGLGRHQHPTGAERFGIKTMGKRLFQ